MPEVIETGDWVTVITPTLTDNALFRTQTVVQLLSRQFRVQLIGFGRGGERYPPLVGDRMLDPELTYHATNIWSWWRAVRALAPKVRGKAIVCVKPLLPSFGAGLLLGRRLGRPVIADVDDWETGLLPPTSLDWELRFYGLSWFLKTNSPLFIRILEGRVATAADVMVSNTFLQGMFGGHWIPHSRGLASFRNAAPAPEGGKLIVSFIGKPRAHKGVAGLMAAWASLQRTDAILRLVVPDPRDPAVAELVGGVPNVEVTGPFPYTELPRLLMESDVVVVPQEAARASLGQLPVKLLDAMAAGRPIVTTDVCDALRWLAGGAGIVVTPGSVTELAAGIGRLLDDAALRSEMGARAKRRLFALASEEILSERYCSVVRAAIEGRSHPAAPAFGG